MGATLEPDNPRFSFPALPLLILMVFPITAWNQGYSYTSPLPGTIQDPRNVPATMNPNTGRNIIYFFYSRSFCHGLKVTAYKCGIKVAEIFREMQVVLLACGNNSPPSVTAPFKDPVLGLYSQYIDTVHAGDLVTFSISARDTENLPNGFRKL